MEGSTIEDCRLALDFSPRSIERGDPISSQDLPDNSIDGTSELSSRREPQFPPHIDQDSEPFLGMEFDSDETAKHFYIAYATRLGFRIRVGKSRTSRRDETVIMRGFVCSKEGYHSKKESREDGKKKRKRASAREGCNARMQVNRREDGRWIVSKLVTQHNHALGGMLNKPKYARSQMDGLPCPSESMSLFGELRPSNFAGGRSVQSLLEYFKAMQAENPAFFYAIQVDGNNCMANVFWADARARMAYSYFGDTVTFDTTYKKNKYLIPFAAFTGVNHHLQPIVFGCALLIDESEASYLWLLETWVTAMYGRHPTSFLTEHDKALTMTISKVFPSTRHRICRWHILNKCKEKLSEAYAANATLKGELKACINGSETAEEFESCWKTIMIKYELRGNNWMQFLYSIRRDWVPLYFKDTFFAEMSRTEKPESMNKFFQTHFDKNASLKEFVIQFDQTMAGRLEKEVQADFATMHTKPALKTPSPIEKQASEIYTRTIFDLFQEEFVQSLGFCVEKIEEGVLSRFRVSKVEEPHKGYFVAFDPSTKRASCDCCKFETSGILCRHVLRVYLVVGVHTLWGEYVLKRWTRNAKSGILMYDCDAEVRSNCQKGLNLRFNDLCRDAIKYAEEGAASSVSYKVAKYALQKAFTEVLAVKKDACSMDSDLLQGGEAIYSQLRNMLMKDALFHGEL